MHARPFRIAVPLITLSGIAALLACGPARPAAPVSGLLDRSIRLTDGVRTVARTRRELGFRLASQPGEPVAFAVDGEHLRAALQRLAPRFRQAAINARPYVFEGELRIDPGGYARSLDVATTASQIVARVQKSAAAVRFTVTLDKKPPVLTAARLEGITGVLATFATRTTGNPKRNKNIRLAATEVDGTLLSPGETFSLREAVGKPTQARGYRTAPVFINAETVPGIGGGVSQVTGTLFNAAALAGLKIVEVNPHSRPVSYLPLGRDATYSHGSKDLKFTNTTGAPIYIAYTLQGRRLVATLFGAKQPGRTVSLRPSVRRRGPGRIDAQLYRVVKEAGKVVAKERLLDHAYRWDPRTRGV